MSTFKSDFLQTVSERGYIHQCTDLEGLDTTYAGSPVPAYIGFDCTADSLHVGSMVPIMLLRRLQQSGHKPIVLMGGGTTKVGDPTGRDSARQMLTDADIARNMAGIKIVFEKFLTFGDGPTDAIMINNADWLDKIPYLEFLRDYGRHFSINRMLSFDSVKLRLERETPMSFLEFNYMILQAYDFLEINRTYGCRLQMGGSDQWGNIINGVELGRRVDGAELFGLTVPLITSASGAKMGKTAQGAVWLNEDRLPAYDYWQFWRNTEDADVGRFLKLFTDLPMDEIRRLETLQGAEINDAKKILANAATTLCRGAEAATAAEETARRTFEQGQTGDALPSVKVGMDALDQGYAVADAMVSTGLSATKGEARRLIKQGAVKINDATLTDTEAKLMPEHLNAGQIKLSAGKKRHALVKIQ
ncbi:MAG: tyrosine--tRNA ligase [Rhodospirillaceae bacterium]|nr:tyrosine--tRNA ligase [Rhodospirillaceae bacterium]